MLLYILWLNWDDDIKIKVGLVDVVGDFIMIVLIYIDLVFYSKYVFVFMYEFVYCLKFNLRFLWKGVVYKDDILYEFGFFLMNLIVL